MVHLHEREDQFQLSGDDLLHYYYDNTRGKWLSHETMVVQCDYNAAHAGATYFYFGFLLMTVTRGFIFPEPATIVGVSGYNAGAASVTTMQLKVGIATTNLGTWSNGKIADDTLDIDVTNTGASPYRVYDNGGGSASTFFIYYKWRLT